MRHTRLTPHQIARILKLHRDGLTNTQISTRFNVCFKSIKHQIDKNKKNKQIELIDNSSLVVYSVSHGRPRRGCNRKDLKHSL